MVYVIGAFRLVLVSLKGVLSTLHFHDLLGCTPIKHRLRHHDLLNVQSSLFDLRQNDQ